MKNNKLLYIYLAIFFIINILQAIFTPISKDEAYYWVYSLALDWGYFDHPPMVALFIKISDIFFDSYLSVRFFTVIIMCVTIFLMWKMISKLHRNANKIITTESLSVFFLLIFASPVFNIYGFITTPDVALIFFGCLYIIVFQKFINNQNFLNTLLLAASAAALIYSKYHGGILILITIISNPIILKKYNIYLTGIFALIFIIPHLLWQYNNDFVSFDYHLNQRTDGAFKLYNIGNYLLGAFTVLNPFLLIFLLVMTIKRKMSFFQNNVLKYVLWGFLIFFLLYSCRGKIEAHWVAIAAIPMTIILHSLATVNQQYNNIIKKISVVSIIIILIIRVIIILPLNIDTEFHRKRKDFFLALQKKASGRRVAFVNSYQNAAKYHFYTKEVAISLNNISYRKSQYNISDTEDAYNQQPVFLVGNWHSEWFETDYLENGDSILYKRIDNFPIISKLNIKLHDPIDIAANTDYSVKATLINPYNYDIYNTAELPFKLTIVLFKNRDRHFIIIDMQNQLDTIAANSEKEIYLNFNTNTIEDIKKYNRYTFTLSCGYLYPQVISKINKID